jgi:endonuclease V-like protein UPF0215 family
VTQARRPHLLGVDDGPFEKHRSRDVPVAAVLMEGHDLVEGIALSRFPVDGEDATGFLSSWIRGLRFHASLQGIVLGGISIAGLGIVDVAGLAQSVEVPVLVVNRRDPARSRLQEALVAARLTSRADLVARSPAAHRTAHGIYLACAGTSPAEAEALVEASRHKADLPEPLRLAHLVAAAVGRGQSRGRV